MDPPNIPYQAYRSKRHSRTISAIPTPTPLLISRQSSVASNGSVAPFSQQSKHFEMDAVVASKTNIVNLVPPPRELPSPPLTSGSSVTTEPSRNASPTDGPGGQLDSVAGKESEQASVSTSPSSTPSSLPSGSTRKSSKFRRVAPRSSVARPSLPPSSLRPPEQSRPPSTSVISQHDQSSVGSPALHTPVTSIGSMVSEGRPSPGNPNVLSDSTVRREVEITSRLTQPASYVVASPRGSSQVTPSQPPERTTRIPITPIATPVTSPYVTTSPLPKVASHSSAPYRPGFQPKGVYRPRTDEFAVVRKAKSDIGRIERTKLERRLEKLINLHFPVDGTGSAGSRSTVEQRRASSIFALDFSSIKNMDPSDLWKGVLGSQALQGSKLEVRAAEQRITPWQEDPTVSKCPLCTSSFHPLTNRKHHCRLCGQIICSLPVKRPRRSEPCSILFVIDPKTRQIEEVGEGVDYGVRKGRSVDSHRKGKQKDDIFSEDEKFLKGIRICRNCKPILGREQCRQEVMRVPVFVTLYESLITLENEIEDWLPHFQELLSTLSMNDQPTKEALTARKRLLDAFADYDALSKRIRKLPCVAGGSQDRVQLAILTRANLFLQKNMFPLQFLPKPNKVSPNTTTPEATTVVDPDSKLAFTLQPLFEQEALLESFVGEATTSRKFEDAKALKANLAEIRAEIERLLSSGDWH